MKTKQNKSKTEMLPQQLTEMNRFKLNKVNKTKIEKKKLQLSRKTKTNENDKHIKLLELKFL